jgi:hypothetical protein
MASEAQQEQAAIHKIGDAPVYFGTRTLAWVRAHPSDPRGAELLGFAFRAMRNGCKLESSSGLRHEVFNMLHTRYRQSEWARRYADFDTEPQWVSPAAYAQPALPLSISLAYGLHKALYILDRNLTGVC